MIDPVLQSFQIEDRSSYTVSSDRSFISREDMERFNPYLKLNVPGLPDSFYSVLSIYNALSLISCDRFVHNEGLSAVSLDDSLGFIMATQGRYPDTVFYSLYRDDWDIGRSSINLEHVDQTSANLEELRITIEAYNSDGLDLGFSSTPTTFKLGLITNLIRPGGSLIVHITQIVDEEWISILVSSFSRLIAYKPATSSPVSVDFYIVCMGRGRQPQTTVEARQEQLRSQLEFLEKYRIHCLDRVLDRESNEALYDVHLAKIQYLGM